LDEALALGAGQVLEQPRLEAFVAIDDEDRQQAARKLRPHDLGAGEVELLGMPLLADDDDLVPRAAPLARDRLRVDVRARAAQQVAVPEQDSHQVPLIEGQGRPQRRREPTSTGVWSALEGFQALRPREGTEAIRPVESPPVSGLSA